MVCCRQDVVNIRRVTTVDTPAGAGGVDEEPDDEGSVDDGVVGEYLDPAKPFRVYAGGFGDPELVGAFATLDEANRLARDAAAEYIAARFHQAPYESSVGRVVEAAPELELPQFSIQDVRPEVEEVVVASVPEESAGNRVWVMAERLFLDGDYGKPGGGEVIMGIYGDVSSAYAAMGKWYNDADRTIFKKETRKCEGMADEVIMVKYGRRKVEVVRIKEHNVE